MKIMLLAYEVESYSMCKIANMLEQDGHEVWIINCDYYTFIDDVSVQNWYSEHGFTKWTNYEEEYRKLYTKEYRVDWEYLKSFEKRFCIDKNLQQLIMTDGILTRSHHHRTPYYTPIKSNDQLYYWVELQLKWCESLFNKINPDVIFTIGLNYFVKNVMWQIASSNKKSIFALVTSRIYGRLYLTENFGYGTGDTIRAYINNDNIKVDELQVAEKYIRHFSDSLFSTDVGTPLEKMMQGAWLNPLNILHNFIYMNTYTIFHGIFKKKRYGRHFQSNYFNSSTLLTILYSFRISFNQLRFKLNNPCTTQLPSMPFIYMPLHVLPESSTLTLSTEYYEADLIRFILKELPAGMCLVVKEHPIMVGDRPFSFYSDVGNLPNVYLLDPRFSSKEIIKKSCGVTGISGTALLEAAMLEKPTHTFGRPGFYDIMDFHGHGEFQDFVKHCVDGKPSCKSIKMLRYVNYMLENGVELPMKDILYSRSSTSFFEGTEAMYRMFKTEIENLNVVTEKIK